MDEIEDLEGVRVLGTQGEIVASMDFFEDFLKTEERLQLFVRSLPGRSRLPSLLELVQPGESDQGGLTEADVPIQGGLKSQILARMLNNLRRHYAQTGNGPALDTVIAMSHGLEAARERGAPSLVQ